MQGKERGEVGERGVKEESGEMTRSRETIHGSSTRVQGREGRERKEELREESMLEIPAEIQLRPEIQHGNPL